MTKRHGGQRRAANSAGKRTRWRSARALNLARGPTDKMRRMTTLRSVFTAAIVALALAAVAQAAPSSSSATASVRATAYMKAWAYWRNCQGRSGQRGRHVQRHLRNQGLHALPRGRKPLPSDGLRMADYPHLRRHLHHLYRYDRASDARSASAESVSRTRPLSPRLPRNQGSAPHLTRRHRPGCTPERISGTALLPLPKHQRRSGHRQVRASARRPSCFTRK